MNEERAELLHQVLDARQLVADALRCVALPAWLSLDLSLGQLRVLLAIADRGVVSVSGLALATRCSRPTASIRVDQLVQRGLVARSEDRADRRRCAVQLTDRGRGLVDRLFPDDAARLRRWCSALGKGDLAALVRGLGAARAHAALRKWGAPSAPARSTDPHLSSTGNARR